jgi:hypothetical protein
VSKLNAMVQLTKKAQTVELHHMLDQASIKQVLQPALRGRNRLPDSMLWCEVVFGWLF